MRIGIQTWGSEGDIRPMMALGARLAAHGHEVELAYTDVAGRPYEEAAAAHGLKARAVGAPVVAAEKALGELIRSGNPNLQFKTIVRWFLDQEAALFDTATELVERSDAVIGHFMLYPLRAAAERAGKPEISVSFAHIVPSRHIPLAGLPTSASWAVQLGWRLARWVWNRAALANVNRLRARLDLPACKGVLDDAFRSKVLALVAVDPAFHPHPPDWGDTTQLCGQLAMAQPWTQGLSPRVEAFLAAGPPPVFMGFGSVMPSEPAQMQETVAIMKAAAASAGCRAIIQATGANPADDSAQILMLERAPHEQLFPRCAAVVHHSGAGTTHTTLRAGVPSVPVPHMADQFGWASELERLGVAHSAVKRKALTASKLANALKRTLADDGLKQRSKALATKTQTEDGALMAARLIEAKLAGRAP